MKQAFRSSFMDKIKWKEGVKRTSGVLWRYFTATCYTVEFHKKALGINAGFTDTKVVDHRAYYRLDEYDRLEKIFKAKVRNNPNYFNTYERLCYKYCKLHLKNAKRISEISVSNKSNKELKSLCESYIASRSLLAVFLNTIHMLSAILNDKVRTELSKLGVANHDQLLSQIIIPQKDSTFMKKELDMLKLATYVDEYKSTALLKNQETLKTNRRLYNLVNQFLASYAWTNINQFFGEELTINDVLTDLRGLKGQAAKKLQDLHSNRRYAKQAAALLLAKFKRNSQLARLVNIARRYLYLETYRIDALNHSDYLIQNLLNEVAARMSLSYSQLVYVSYQEILDFLITGQTVPVARIAERKRGYAILNINGKVSIYSGSRLDKYLKSVGVKIQKPQILKGIVGNPGYWAGRVRIIKDIRDIKKIEKGEVLVTAMTHHSIIPAVRKAGAIVTDEGGLICHAAIISREFKIPCVISTKVATRVFKDGDRVEVDASKGVVRKI